MEVKEDITLTRKRPLETLTTEERLQRSRERNREHARRTRMRKKAQLATLQSRVTQLRTEGLRLEQALQDCVTANILLGISKGGIKGSEAFEAIFAGVRMQRRRINSADLAAAMNESDDAATTAAPLSYDALCRSAHLACSSLGQQSSSSSLESPVAASLRRASMEDDDAASVSEDSSMREPDSLLPPKPPTVAKPTIHWKNGYTLDQDGQRRDLTPEELDTMRRERNRLHAKMTRDRKKVYIETLSRAIACLEEDNKRIRAALSVQLNACISQPEKFLANLGLLDDHNVTVWA